jgi:translation initiation factor 4E
MAAAVAPAIKPAEHDKKEGSGTDTVTVFQDSVNFNVKHPLQHRWTLWYDCAGKKVVQSAWGDQLRKVVTVDTVEDFWGLYNNIIPASKLSVGANYHLFKEGIEPKWEDETNAKGGKWLTVLPAKARTNGSLDKLWLWSLLACIGEAFDDENEICGCVVSIRKGGDKIALWTRTSSLEAVQKRIGVQFKAALELQEPLQYQSHADAMRRGSSFSNRARYEL